MGPITTLSEDGQEAMKIHTFQCLVPDFDCLGGERPSLAGFRSLWDCSRRVRVVPTACAGRGITNVGYADEADTTDVGLIDRS